MVTPFRERITNPNFFLGKPDVDVTAMNIDRFHRFQSNPEYREARVSESLGLVYMCHYPYKKKLTARDSKKTPFYDREALAGAVFNDISGWEVPDHYGGPKKLDKPEIYTWGKPSFFERWKKEHVACREGVALFDMSFMSKFFVQGRDAGKCVNRLLLSISFFFILVFCFVRLCTADVDGPVDTITYTQFLNEDGKMEADVTVCKLATDKFMVIATDTMHRHVETWLSRHLDPTGTLHVFSHDVTGGYAQLNIQGPRSRELLQAITDTDMSDKMFPFRAARTIAIGHAPVLCARITYVSPSTLSLYLTDIGWGTRL